MIKAEMQSFLKNSMVDYVTINGIAITNSGSNPDIVTKAERETMYITNMRKFAQTARKQLSMHYNMQPSSITELTIQNIAETIIHTSGSQTILTDHIHSYFANDMDTTPAHNAAKNILANC